MYLNASSTPLDIQRFELLFMISWYSCIVIGVFLLEPSSSIKLSILIKFLFMSHHPFYTCVDHIRFYFISNLIISQLIFYFLRNYSNNYLCNTKRELLMKFSLIQLAHKDSNLEMTESESVALPFGDGPICCLNKWYYTHITTWCQAFFKLF